jgi:hypothetical protein
MVFAGEEFAADQRSSNLYTDLQDPMRSATVQYVCRLVKLRTSHPALSINDTKFIHVDCNDGKRGLAWARGAAGMDPVVVLANFSDFVSTSSGSAAAEYVVPRWPATPVGKQWRGDPEPNGLAGLHRPRAHLPVGGEGVYDVFIRSLLINP